MVEGGSIKLECPIESRTGFISLVEWHKLDTIGGHLRIIRQSGQKTRTAGQYRNRVEISDDRAITLDSVQPHDAGKYKCSVSFDDNFEDFSIALLKVENQKIQISQVRPELKIIIYTGV